MCVYTHYLSSTDFDLCILFCYRYVPVPGIRDALYILNMHLFALDLVVNAYFHRMQFAFNFD